MHIHRAERKNMQNWKLPLSWQNTEYIFSNISLASSIIKLFEQKNSLKIICWMVEWMHEYLNGKMP